MNKCIFFIIFLLFSCVRKERNSKADFLATIPVSYDSLLASKGVFSLGENEYWNKNFVFLITQNDTGVINLSGNHFKLPLVWQNITDKTIEYIYLNDTISITFIIDNIKNIKNIKDVCQGILKIRHEERIISDTIYGELNILPAGKGSINSR